VVLQPATESYLLGVARYALWGALGVDLDPPRRPPDDGLARPARVFVSWHRLGRLVGCIGTLEPSRTLEAAVKHFAVQSGLHDPRTSAATRDDLEFLDCEISILSEPRPLGVAGFTEIERGVVPGRDGVILCQGLRRAVFLPVVWATIPSPRDFLEALCRKGGMDPSTSDPPLSAETFRVHRLPSTPSTG
jgi:uncharacterized protein